MDAPGRLAPLSAQYDHACDRLVRCMAGPAFDSGNGVLLQVDAMSDEELLWEPVRGCWSVRPRSQGPGHGAEIALLRDLYRAFSG